METVYLVYENQYADEVPEVMECYTEKGLIDFAEQKRQDFIVLENHQTPIQELEDAKYFLEFVAEYTTIKKYLL